MSPLAEMLPGWFRATPFGAKVEAERDAARRDLHDALVLEKSAVAAEAERDRPALERTLAAAEAKVERVQVTLDAAADVRREAALALRGFDRALERRLVLLDKQLVATSDPRVAEVAALVQDEIVSGLRSGSLALANGGKPNAAAKQFQNVATELRQQVVLATTGDGAAAIEAARAAVLEALGGSSRSHFARRFEQVLNGAGAA